MSVGTLQHKHAHGVVKSISRDQREFSFIANRLEVDRDSEVVVPSGLDITEFQANPVLLAFHDHLKPIGRVTSLTLRMVDGIPSWVGVGRLDPPGTSDDSDKAHRQVQSGSLNGISIGFLGVEASPRAVLPGQNGLTHTKTRLMEISLVSVPSCANCLVLEKTLAKEPVMNHCACNSEIDWAALARTASNKVEVDVSKDDVRRVINHLMPVFREGLTAGLKVQAQLAAHAAMCRMTGRLD
ncbi:MAG: HK97 family phage prohead protease [Nitrospira sp.]|nr:HK97 family phage prohead protease [Nitrospira sp.]